MSAGRIDYVIAAAIRSAVLFLVASVLALGALVSCAPVGPSGSVPTLTAPNTIRLLSPSFERGGPIPAEFTCDGEGVSPSLAWSPSPQAAEYALTVTDPDAPGGTFVHWLVYGIAGEASSIPEGGVPEGALEGTNDFGQPGYGPPCPPAGSSAHHYVFTLYRLSRRLGSGLEPGASIDELLNRIRCCVDATGTLTGVYSRSA